MRRRAILLLLVTAAALALSSGVAFAQIIIGTDNGETLTGTNSADQITGRAGNDTLVGKAGNDTYHFDDGWGQDTLTEMASVKVRKKKLPGGTDTLNFSQFSSGGLTINMIPQWANVGYNFVSISSILPDNVDLGSSPVEKAVGGSGTDNIYGGSASNTYKGGPGGSDVLFDYGGRPGDSLPALAASNDTFKGFTSGTGTDRVIDFGGTADKLDLRPLESSDVYVDRFSFVTIDSSEESLRIVIDSNTSVEVIGFFSPYYLGQQNGRMEQIIFSNEVVTNAASMM